MLKEQLPMDWRKLYDRIDGWDPQITLVLKTKLEQADNIFEFKRLLLGKIHRMGDDYVGIGDDIEAMDVYRKECRACSGLFDEIEHPEPYAGCHNYVARIVGECNNIREMLRGPDD